MGWGRVWLALPLPTKAIGPELEGRPKGGVSSVNMSCNAVFGVVC